jgi:Alginate export
MPPKSLALACSLLLLVIAARAQPFQPMRYDENYAFLKDSTRNLYQRLKFCPLNKKGDVYVTFGGGIRYEFDAFNNEDWGQFKAGKDNFFLQRYGLHADLHLGDRLRIYAELRSALENGRPHGPRPIDEDKGNLENYFADFRILTGRTDTLTIRGGRQEINYGSGRLISVRDGPNLRSYFTGAKLMYTHRNLSVDVLAMEADSVYTGAFDNKGTKELNLWGTYASIALPVVQHIDWYYLGIRRDNAAFQEGTENEIRQTFGMRIWRTGNGINYDLEGAYQLGRFGTGNNNIHAWAAFADVSYRFGDLKWSPQIGIRNDYMSGDKKAGDGALQSFNPIYPKAGYFSGFDPQVGAVNLIDVHPYFSALPLPNLTFNVDVAFNWRYSLHDGVYRPNGVLHLPGNPGEQRYIGTAWLVKIGYNINAWLNINFGAQLFNTGPYIDKSVAMAKSPFLTNSQLVFKF